MGGDVRAWELATSCGDVVMTVEADVDPLLPLLEEVVVVGLGHSCVRGGVDSILPLPHVLTLLQSALRACTLE